MIEKVTDDFVLVMIALWIGICLLVPPVSATCSYGNQTTYQSCYDAAFAYCIQNDLRPCGDFASSHCDTCATPTPTPTPSYPLS